MFFLHIGIHKTGSSSIQRTLARNEELLGEAGFDFFSLGRKNSGHVGRLGRAIARQQEREGGVIRKFTRFLESSARPNQLMTSERLEALNQSQAAFLRELIGDRPTRLVVYLRKHEDAIESAYLEQIKRGYTSLGLDEWFTDIVEEPKKNRGFLRFDYEGLLQRWTAAGFDDIDVRRYDRRLLVGGDIVEDFLAALGIPKAVQARFERIPVVNPSLPARYAPLVREVLLAREDLPRAKNYRRIQPLLEVLIGEMGAERRSLLDAEKLRRLEELFGEANRRIARERFGEDELFPATPRPPLVDGGALDSEEVARIVGPLLEALAARPGASLSTEEDDEDDDED